jgi:hypothetical protein
MGEMRGLQNPPAGAWSRKVASLLGKESRSPSEPTKHFALDSVLTVADGIDNLSVCVPILR